MSKFLDRVPIGRATGRVPVGQAMGRAPFLVRRYRAPSAPTGAALERRAACLRYWCAAHAQGRLLPHVAGGVGHPLVWGGTPDWPDWMATEAFCNIMLATRDQKVPPDEARKFLREVMPGVQTRNFVVQERSARGRLLFRHTYYAFRVGPFRTQPIPDRISQEVP